MTCKNCTPETSFLKGLIIQKVQHDPSIETGSTWHIYVDVLNKSILVGDYGRVCIYEGDNVIAQSNSFFLRAGEVVRLALSGTMSEIDLYANVSLVEEEFGYTNCCDAIGIYIENGEDSHINPGDPPKPNDDDLEQWIMDNLVLILILLLVIIIILKYL